MPIIVAVLALGIFMILAERLAPGRTWPRVSGWWLRAIGFNLIQAGSVLLAGLTWDRWLPGFSLRQVLDIGAPGTVGGAILGYVVTTFIYYWWHRWRHDIPSLWRWFHQLHHSPQRIEIITSFYKHPFELLANSLLSSLIMYTLLGLNPAAATWTMLATGIAELIYHWNVRTPYWLGFIFQRPESHCVHHQEGLHSYNFGDLPLWDMLFGTFYNPKTFGAACGFGPIHEHEVATMLRGVDVYRQDVHYTEA